MGIDAINLPSDKSALAHIIRSHAESAEMHIMYKRMMWFLAYYYLNGYRRFNLVEPRSGRVQPFYLDEEGNMEFQCQELLFAINQTAGRIGSMDARPAVMHQGFSLSNQRNRALTQILLDSTVGHDPLRRVSDEFAWIFTCYGFAGLQGHVVDHPTIGLTSDIEVIHPKDLFPFPHVGMDFTRLGGLMRSHWISIDFLREKFGSRFIKSRLDKMEWLEADPSDIHQADENTPNSGITWFSSDRGVAPKGGAKEEAGPKESIGVARVRELWVTGPRNTTVRYSLASGDEILQDEDTRGLETYCPIGWARFFNNGTFHGAGMFELMYSIHRQLELLQKSLFNNIRDIDRYPILIFPQGQINQQQFLRDVGRGLKVAFWEPDPISEGFNPFPVAPVNAGELPGKVAQFAREGMRVINPIQDIIQEKGRVDSADGLRFLDEQITRALTTPTGGVQRAFGDMYRSLAQKTIQQLTISERTIPAGTLTLDLAGAVIDKDGGVSFTVNPIPTISTLSFDIRSVSPKNTLARKSEAIQMWELGIEQDPLSFRIHAVQEGLDLSLRLGKEEAAVEMGVRTILTLYGDGRAPGQIIITPHTTAPNIVLLLLEEFMLGPAMQVASVEVINAFRQLRLTLLSYMGAVLPGQIPNPDDSAAMAEMMAQQGGIEPGMGPSPGAPPGMSAPAQNPTQMMGV